MQDRVIVVSGGAGGIGAEICRRLLADGARVVVADLNLEHAPPASARLLNVACDITNPAQCDTVAQSAVDKFGRLDGMVNCAA